MSTMKERWTAAKPLVYQQISDAIMRTAAYEPNNKYTWNRVKTEVEYIVSRLVGLGYLEDFKVVCDNTNNTEEGVEANEFHLDFAWKLDDGTEITIVSFVLSPRGIEIQQ